MLSIPMIFTNSVLCKSSTTKLAPIKPASPVINILLFCPLHNLVPQLFTLPQKTHPTSLGQKTHYKSPPLPNSCLAQINNIMRPPRNHMNRFNLITRQFELNNLTRIDISFLNKPVPDNNNKQLLF